MRNAILHEAVESFTAEAADALAGATANGDEIAFEVVESGRGARGPRVPLYCYRPLTGAFIEDRAGLLRTLASYAPVARVLEILDGTDAYIRRRGGTFVPHDPRERADEVLRLFLERVFEDRSEFDFEPVRFDQAYNELEQTLYSGRCVATVIAPMLGIMLEEGADEINLSDGLSLIRGDRVADLPWEAAWGHDGERAGEEPCVLAMLRTSHERSSQPPVSEARRRFRRLLTTLRLYERGGYGLGPLAWSRVDDGAWQSIPLGVGGRPRFAMVLSDEDAADLRSIYGQVTRRMPAPVVGEPGAVRVAEVPVADTSGRGELAWALARFEMGCDRLASFEALTDYLLGLRALLEPEGPSSGRLAQRLAVICALGEDRLALSERTAQAIALERAVIAGLGPVRPGADALVEEIADHLRAILRDVLCGHLDVDVRSVADDLLARAAVGAG